VTAGVATYPGVRLPVDAMLGQDGEPSPVALTSVYSNTSAIEEN
jgi:hypothetical protein